ncbi:unnamed protein product [Plutella xylostella]|uniref:(diamondback moth) hypothetical protein n=1 Tax=Plutella xylostella TaxID=51655 RepID=A0A8S4G7I8_PLUXY|nr:unnamed protein product [Plutella xylostella]
MVIIASPTEDDQPLCSSHREPRTTAACSPPTASPIPIANYVVVVVDSYTDFDRVVGRLVARAALNPSALFLILYFHFASSNKINIEHAEDMVACLFSWNVFNIIVIVPETGNLRNALGLYVETL